MEVSMDQVHLGQVLEMAIAQEVAANRMYKDLAARAQDQAAKEALEFLATEELQHKEFLEAYQRGEIPAGALAAHEVIDAHVAETLGTPTWSPKSKPEDAFLMAAGQERLAHEFYRRLAEIHPDGEVRELLFGLAQEELAHKEKVEYLYANTAFPQTDGG
jgi:rubrerythrin